MATPTASRKSSSAMWAKLSVPWTATNVAPGTCSTTTRLAALRTNGSTTGKRRETGLHSSTSAPFIGGSLVLPLKLRPPAYWTWRLASAFCRCCLLPAAVSEGQSLSSIAGCDLNPALVALAERLCAAAAIGGCQLYPRRHSGRGYHPGVRFLGARPSMSSPPFTCLEHLEPRADAARHEQAVEPRTAAA